MANEKNLILNSERTPKERKEQASKAGIASGKARKEKKAMKDTLDVLLSMPLKDGKAANIEKIRSVASMKGKNISVQEAIILAQIQKAVKGDSRAAELIIELSGNKQKEKIEISGVVANPFAELTTEELKKLIDDD